MLARTVIFAIVHSGLASLRDTGEKLIGEHADRVLFAGLSRPLAVSTAWLCRYGGTQQQICNLRDGKSEIQMGGFSDEISPQIPTQAQSLVEGSGAVLVSEYKPVPDVDYLQELLAIQQQGPRAIGFFGTRNMGFMHQELIEILSYALVITVGMLARTVIFAIVHSGLASLRDTGEKLIGEHADRVLFAGLSRPLAVSTAWLCRYGGTQQQICNLRDGKSEIQMGGFSDEISPQIPTQAQSLVEGSGAVLVSEYKPVPDVDYLQELLAIQQQGPRAIGFFGTRNMGFMHQELIEILSYALVITVLLTINNLTYHFKWRFF
ncbi:hypothetical protein F511_10865 [Dorcoceras hygrometricum]|uniref:Uncharacterized protein n=1 Tax=Dorcoceras hygrometricum TaxID=472368 RepID=A0A2Z7C0M8_9LAMI|nr:hypothetical protein F511_10865 [Dorcoceras hygrometricum]